MILCDFQFLVPLVCELCSYYVAVPLITFSFTTYHLTVGVVGKEERDGRSCISPKESPCSDLNSLVDVIHNNIRVGSRVEGDWKQVGNYYSATVTKLNADKTFDILYDDGDIEKHLKITRIKCKKEVPLIVGNMKASSMLHNQAGK